jgi:hypothetical protein
VLRTPFFGDFGDCISFPFISSASVGLVGNDPTTFGLKDRCSNQLSYKPVLSCFGLACFCFVFICFSLVGRGGVEPLA